MANNNIRVRLTFDADATAAKRQVQELQQTLSNVATMPIGSKLGAQMTAGLQKAQQSAIQLKVALNQATNVNTGKLNLNAFDAQLKKSKMTLTQYAIELSKLGPEGQQAFAQLTQAIASADTPLQALKAKMGKFGTTLGNTIRWSISSALITGVTSSLSSIVDYAKELDESLTKIGIVTGKNTEQMESFAKAAQKAAKALSVSTTDYMEASLIYFQQGYGEREAMKRADVTVKLANVLGEEMETVSDWMTAIWNNFYDGSQSLEYYADALAKLGAATASSADEIAGGMEKFVGIADTIGLSFEYAAAALTTVTAETRQSEEVVGTALKTIFARLENLKLGDTLEDGTSLGQYSEALAAVGVHIKDSNGELLDMDNILDQVGAKWQTLARDEQVALAQSVAGIRQYSTFMSLMDNYDIFEKNAEMAKDSNGALAEQTAIYENSIEAVSKRVENSLERIKKELFGAEDMKPTLEAFETILDFVGDLLETLGGFETVLNLIVVAMMKAFGPKMINGAIAGFQSIRSAWSGGKEGHKNKMLDELGSASTNIMGAGGTLTEADQANLGILQNETDLTRELQSIQDKISTEAYEQLKLSQQRLKVYEDTVRVSAQLKDSTKSELDDSRFDMLGVLDAEEASLRELGDAAMSEDDWGTASHFDAQAGEARAAKNALGDYEAQVQKEEDFFAADPTEDMDVKSQLGGIFEEGTQVEELQGYSELTGAVNAYKEALQQLAQAEQERDQAQDPQAQAAASQKMKQAAANATTAAKGIDKYKRAIVDNNKTLTKSNKTFGKFSKFFTGKEQKNLDKYTKGVRSHAKATAENTKANQKYEKSLKNQRKAMQQAQIGAKNWGKVISAALGSIVQAAMAMQMLTNGFEELGRAIKTGEMDTSKWLSLITTMGPALLMLIGPATKVISKMYAWGSAIDKKRLKQKQDSVETQDNTKETDSNTRSKEKNANVTGRQTKGKKLKVTVTNAETDAIKSGTAAEEASQTTKKKGLLLAAKEKIAHMWSAVAKAASAVANVPFAGPALAVAAAAAILGIFGLSASSSYDKGSDEGEKEAQTEAANTTAEHATELRDFSNAALEASEGLHPLIDTLKEYTDEGKSVTSINESIAESLEGVVEEYEKLAIAAGKENDFPGLKQLKEILTDLKLGKIIDPELLEDTLQSAETEANTTRVTQNQALIDAQGELSRLNFDQSKVKKFANGKDGFEVNGKNYYWYANQGPKQAAHNIKWGYDQVVEEIALYQQKGWDETKKDEYEALLSYYQQISEYATVINESEALFEDWAKQVVDDEDKMIDMLGQSGYSVGSTVYDFSEYQENRENIISYLMENYNLDREAAIDILEEGAFSRNLELRYSIKTTIDQKVEDGVITSGLGDQFKGFLSKDIFENEDIKNVFGQYLEDGETYENRVSSLFGLAMNSVAEFDSVQEMLDWFLEKGKEENQAEYKSLQTQRMKKLKANFDLENDIDIYYEYEQVLEQIERSLTAIGREKDKAFGKSKANAIKTEIAQLEKESEVQRKLADQAQERAAELRGTLSQEWGLTFDQNGTLQGYVEKQRALTAEIQKLDEDDSDRERLETKLELLNSIVSAYDEAVSKAADAWDTIDENADTISDLKLEDIQIEVEVYAQLSEASLREVEFQLSRLEDLDYEVAVKVTAYQSQYQGKQQEFDSAEKGFNRMLEEKGIDPTAYWAGDQTAKDQFLNANWTQAELDQLKEYQETMNSSVLDMKDSWLSMHETVRSGMEYYNEEMDNGIAKMEHWNTLLEDYNNIIDLVGAKNLGISDDQQLDMLGTQTTILQGQVAAAKSKLDMNKAFLAEAERELANAEDALTKAGESATEEDKRRVEEWKATVQQAQESVMESQEELNQYLTASLEAAMAEKSKAVEIAIKNFMKQLTGYESIDLFNEDRDRMRQQGKLFVDEYEKVYNLAKLNREINTSLDKTNLKNRTDLLKLQERINAAQKSGVKMSQFELDNLQKQYQLEMAKIQLEEAQNNKSQVVLKRDTEGNFGYVYTANADKVSEATQKYEDAIYAIMTANEDYMKQCSENMDEALATYLKTVQTIEEDMTLTEEERQNRLDQAKTWYLTQQAYYTGEMANVTGITKDLFDQESAKRNETVEQMCGYNQAYVDDYIQTFQPQMSKALSETNGYWDAFAKRIDEETYYNLKDYDKNYISSWDTNFLQAMESRLGEGSDLRTAYQGFVDAIGSPGDQGTGGTGLYGALGTADWNMREDMNKAFEQAGIDVNTHLNGDGENSAKTGLDTFADYLDKLINGGDGEEGLKDKVEDLTDEIEGIKTDGIDKITGTIGALSLWEEQAWGEFNTLFLKVQELNKELVTLADNLRLEYEDPETKIPLGNGVVLGSYSTSEDEKKWGSYQTYDSYGSVVDGGKAGINLNAGTPYTVTSYTNDKGENFYSLYDSASGKTTIMNETDFKAAGFQPHSKTPTTDPDDDDEEQTPTTTNETASFKVGDIINASGFPNGILAYSKNSDGTFTFGVGKNNYDSMIGAGRDDDFDGAKILEVANDTKTGKVFYKLKARGGTSEVWLPQTWSESGSPNYKLEKAAASKYNVNDKVETNASWTSAWTVRAYKWDSNTGNFVSGDLESGKLTIAEKRFWNNKWYYRNQGDDWFWGGQLRTYDTGGYTGSWGPEGRLAMLHQKEIVLNAHDTENFLTAINIVRSMADRLEANAKLTQQGLLSYATAITPHNYRDTLEQNVTIHAEFPNATNHSEIEEAFGNLVNLAAQYASRTY